MNRSKKIRVIFFELRRELGNQISARELLKAARSLVDLQGDNWTRTPTFELRAERTNLDQLELDFAMADGGWGVYQRERELVSIAGIDDRFEWRRRLTASEIVEELEGWQN